MTRSRFCFVAAVWVLAVSVSAPAWAQTPNFSGTWKFDAAKSTGEPVVPRIFNPTGVKPTSMDLILQQTPTELHLTMGEARLLYKLDGTEANVSADGRAGFPMGKASWDGRRLVINLTQEVFDAKKFNYVKVPGKEVYSLNGNVLTVEKSQTMLDGSVQTKKLVYTKSATT